MGISTAFRAGGLILAAALTWGAVSGCKAVPGMPALAPEQVSSFLYPDLPSPYRRYLTRWRTTTAAGNGMVAAVAAPVLTLGRSQIEMAPAGGYSTGGPVHLSWELGPAIAACVIAVEAGAALPTINVERLAHEWVLRCHGRPWAIDPEVVGRHIASGTMRATYLNAPSAEAKVIAVPAGTWWPDTPIGPVLETSDGTAEVDCAGSSRWWINVEEELVLVWSSGGVGRPAYHVFPW